MKTLRLIGSLAFVLGLFTAIFVGIPWYAYSNPILPWWLRIAIYSLVGGILIGNAAELLAYGTAVKLGDPGA